MNKVSKANNYYAIRLKVKELLKASIEKDIPSDTQLAEAIGVSRTQMYRAKLPKTDPQYNAPGPNFIAGVLGFFGGKFEDFFFLEDVIRERIIHERKVI